MEPGSSLPHSQLSAICSYPEPDQSSPNPPPSHLPQIHLNIVLPSTPGSSKCTLSLRFPHKNPVYTSPLPHARYMSRPSHSSRFDHPINTGYGVQIITFLVIKFFHSPVISSLLGPNIILNNLFSNTLSLRSSLNVSDQVSHP